MTCCLWVKRVFFLGYSCFDPTTDWPVSYERNHLKRGVHLNEQEKRTRKKTKTNKQTKMMKLMKLETAEENNVACWLKTVTRLNILRLCKEQVFHSIASLRYYFVYMYVNISS